MARIRTIKPEFFLSEDIGSLTVNARLLYVALWCQVDREGRGRFNRVALMAHCMPYEMDRFDSCFNELIDTGLVRRYEAEEKKYFDIPTFTEHQRPHHSEKDGGFPEYNGGSTVTTPLDDGKKKVGKGKGKGKEREKEKSAVAPVAELFPPGLNVEAWDAYLDHRRQIKARTLKPASIRQQQEWLGKQGNYNDQATIVETTIRNGWTGLFERNKGRQPNQRTAADEAAVEEWLNEKTDNVIEGEAL